MTRKFSIRGSMAKFRVSLGVSQEMCAEDEGTALDIFWEDLLSNKCEEEFAYAERLE